MDVDSTRDRGLQPPSPRISRWKIYLLMTLLLGILVSGFAAGANGWDVVVAMAWMALLSTIIICVFGLILRDRLWAIFGAGMTLLLSLQLFLR